MNDEKAQQLGEYIRYIRKAHGTSIRALAAQAGIDSGGLARLECGNVATPRPDTLCALALALEVSLADMFVLAGYVVPHDLPNIRPYLRVKYSCLPDEDVLAITEEVERAAALHTLKSNGSRNPRGNPKNS
jgi:transcriptional regulator with XRE-family HTH domain